METSDTLYKPTGGQLLRHALASDIILQSILPRPSMDQNSPDYRGFSLLGQAFVQWIDGELKASEEIKKAGGGDTELVVHTGKILNFITAFSAAMAAYGIAVLVRPDQRGVLLDEFHRMSREITDKALVHCDNTYNAVISGLAEQANEKGPRQ